MRTISAHLGQVAGPKYWYAFAGGNPVGMMDPKGKYILPFTTNYVMNVGNWKEKTMGNFYYIKEAGCNLTAVCNAVNAVIKTNYTLTNVNNDTYVAKSITNVDVDGDFDGPKFVKDNNLKYVKFDTDRGNAASIVDWYISSALNVSLTA